MGDIVTRKKMKYKVTKVDAAGAGEVILIKVKKRRSDRKFKSLKIDNYIKINGKLFKITAISARVLCRYKYLKKITIGGNITTIGKKAFYQCTKLKKIVIHSTKLKSVGIKAIRGINKRARIKIPKKSLKPYKKIFRPKVGYRRSMKIKK